MSIFTVPPDDLMLTDENATRVFGATLARYLEKAEPQTFMLTLIGDLGTGKTTLCQGLAEALGCLPGEVVSPSFTLVNEYQARKTVYHMDLYRLGDNPVKEFIEAGLDEYLDGWCLVEWPRRLPDDFWPMDRLELSFCVSGEGRLLRGRGYSVVARELWLSIWRHFEIEG